MNRKEHKVSQLVTGAPSESEPARTASHVADKIIGDLFSDDLERYKSAQSVLLNLITERDTLERDLAKSKGLRLGRINMAVVDAKHVWLVVNSGEHAGAGLRAKTEELAAVVEKFFAENF